MKVPFRLLNEKTFQRVSNCSVKRSRLSVQKGREMRKPGFWSEMIMEIKTRLRHFRDHVCKSFASQCGAIGLANHKYHHALYFDFLVKAVLAAALGNECHGEMYFTRKKCSVILNPVHTGMHTATWKLVFSYPKKCKIDAIVWNWIYCPDLWFFNEAFEDPHSVCILLLRYSGLSCQPREKSLLDQNEKIQFSSHKRFVRSSPDFANFVVSWAIFWAIEKLNPSIRRGASDARDGMV